MLAASIADGGVVVGLRDVLVEWGYGNKAAANGRIWLLAAKEFHDGQP
jgi:hypothetical protein